MTTFFEKKLKLLANLINKKEFSISDAVEVLSLIDINISPEFLDEIKIYSEYLPVAATEKLYTTKLRLLHFIWDSLDKSSYSLAANFAIQLRQLLAKQLFRKCGKNFICESGVTFNIPQKISIGDNVFLNRGVFIDSKGNVEIGNSVAITEQVMIFSHTHSESKHSERSYAPVKINDYAKIYSKAMILPGVTIGREALVAGNSVVTKDVPPNTLHGGMPAKYIRDRRQNNLHDKELDHTWLYDGAFQHN